MRVLLVTLGVVFLGCGPMTVVPDAGGNGMCRDTMKNPPNLLENPGFECDTSPAAWSQVYGTLALVPGGRSGRAAQVMVNAAGGRFAYAKDFAVDAGLKSFCFSAYVSGTAPFMRMRVLRVLNGSVTEVSQSDQVFGDFRRTPLGTPLKVGNENAPKLQLIFEAQTNRGDGLNAVAGDTLLIDDVDVWETSGTCGEAR
jgi:hypothetical protein